MDLSPGAIPGVALTAATSLGAVVAGHAPVVGAAVTSVGSTAAQAVSAAAPHVAAATVSSAASVGGVATDAARGLALVEKPAKVAAGAVKASPLLRFAAGVSRVLPWVTIGASLASGAQAVQGGGAQALIHTKSGRGAVLGVLGGSLLLIPTPVTQLGAAAVLAGVAANEFGAFRGWDTQSPQSDT